MQFHANMKGGPCLAVITALFLAFGIARIREVGLSQEVELRTSSARHQEFNAVSRQRLTAPDN